MWLTCITLINQVFFLDIPVSLLSQLYFWPCCQLTTRTAAMWIQIRSTCYLWNHLRIDIVINMILPILEHNVYSHLFNFSFLCFPFLKMLFMYLFLREWIQGCGGDREGEGQADSSLGMEQKQGSISCLWDHDPKPKSRVSGLTEPPRCS